MKILLAEDDPVFQIMLQRALTKWGYESVVVGDGGHAWEQLSGSGGPRLAIVDWVMPVADGPEVCRRVRGGNLPHYVYMILLTSKADVKDLMEGLKAGADDYLSKPVNLDELNLRLRAGCRVLESEERHRMIAETASEGIITTESKYRIRFANRAAARILGHQPAELIGQDLCHFVPLA